MANDMALRNFWNTPTFADLWEDEDPAAYGTSNNLSISEDDKNVYLEVAVPGVNPDDIDITYDKGMLWIRCESTTEENQKKKYYRKAARSFSYRIAVPGDIDPNTEPEASCNNGLLTVTFRKSAKEQPKKISLKGSKNKKSERQVH